MDEQRHINPWIIAVAVMLGTFLEVLDTTIVNVALPHIAGSLSASVDEATWALTSYLVANAVILPMTGWLASFFGRKRLLLMSVTGFTVSSILCGLSTTLPMLIFFRIIQGATGGGLQPLSQAVLMEAFPPEDRGKAMGFWGFGIVVAPILGPMIGGWLTDNMSWHWVFFVNIPVGIAAIIMIQLFIFDPPYLRRSSGGVDYWGIGLLAVWIGALQIVLDKGQQEDWLASHMIVWLVVIFVASLTFFLIREMRAEHPVVDLRVFRSPTYATGVALMTILGFALYGSLVLLPIWLQTLMGYPAYQAGIAMSPRGLGSMVAMPVVGIMVARVDARKLLAAGLLIAGGTMVQLSRLNLNAGFWDFCWPQFVQGISLGLIFVPLTTVTMGTVAKERMGNATSIFNLMRNVGGSMGIAAVTTMVARQQQTQINVLGRNITQYNPATRQMMGALNGAFHSAGADPVTAGTASYTAMWGMLLRQASLVSFVNVFQILGVVFLIMLPLLLIMRKPTGTAADVAAH